MQDDQQLPHEIEPQQQQLLTQAEAALDAASQLGAEPSMSPSETSSGSSGMGGLDHTLLATLSELLQAARAAGITSSDDQLPEDLQQQLQQVLQAHAGAQTQRAEVPVQSAISQAARPSAQPAQVQTLQATSGSVAAASQAALATAPASRSAALQAEGVQPRDAALQVVGETYEASLQVGLGCFVQCICACICFHSYHKSQCVNGGTSPEIIACIMSMPALMRPTCPAGGKGSFSAAIASSAAAAAAGAGRGSPGCGSPAQRTALHVTL